MDFSLVYALTASYSCSDRVAARVSHLDTLNRVYPDSVHKKTTCWPIVYLDRCCACRSTSKTRLESSRTSLTGRPCCLVLHRNRLPDMTDKDEQMTEASNEEEDWDQLNAEGPEDPTEDGTPEESYHSDDEEVRQNLSLIVAVCHVCICLAPNAGPDRTRMAQIWPPAKPFI